MVIGMVGPGFMGAGLGGALRDGGARVVTTLDGRSARSGRLAGAAGLEVLDSLDELAASADVILVVTPPAAATGVAAQIIEAAGRGQDVYRECLQRIDGRGGSGRADGKPLRRTR